MLNSELKRYDPVTDFGIDFKKIPIIVKQAKQYMGHSSQNGPGRPIRVKFLGPKVAVPRNNVPKFYKRQIKDYVQYSLLPFRPVSKHRSSYPKYRKYYRVAPKRYYRYRPYYPQNIDYVDVEPFYEDEQPYLMQYRPAYEQEQVPSNDIEDLLYGEERPVDYRVPYYPDVYGEYNNYNKEKVEAQRLHQALVNANYFKKSQVDSDTAYSENYYSAFPSSQKR